MDRDAIRKRPGMYAGNVADGTGLHNLLFELVTNARAEARTGHCDRIDIELNADGSVTVRDTGRGIPVDLHPTLGKPVAEIIATTLHAGGRFGEGTGDGIGLAVVNALSEILCLRIRRDGTEYVLRFRQGKREATLQTVGSTTMRGTEVTFTPDAAIFSGTRFDAATIERRLRALAVTGATVTLTDRRA